MDRPARTLSLLDCVSIGINGIVGSGIYLLIADLAHLAGAVSIVGIAACGALCILIALCFAELGGMYDRNGGAYVYTRAAFGPWIGFGVGWMSMATGVLAFAAVARGFAEALSVFVPVLKLDLVKFGGFAFQGTTAVAMALIATLGTINYLGVKAGARTSDLLSAAKMLPLIALALVGLFFLKPAALSLAHLPPASDGRAQTFWQAVAQSAFLAVFMISGFEYTAVPAGEAKEARRNIPLAIVGSLVGATLLYVILQAVALSTVPDLASRKQPLIDAAAFVFGQAGRVAFGIAAMVSMAGFCAGSALVGPRYFTALADDGYLPRRLSGLSRFGTPGPATLVATGLSLLLALFLGYGSLVDVSNVALFAQYIPVSLAVIALRRKAPSAERLYTLPFGFVIPALAAGFSCALLIKARPERAEWLFSGQILAGGVVVWAVTALARRWWTSRPGAKPAPS